MREHMGCDLANAVRWVIIPCLRKQDKRFVVSRINRIERALFNNRKLAIEVMRQSIPFECLCRIPVELIMDALRLNFRRWEERINEN